MVRGRRSGWSEPVFKVGQQVSNEPGCLFVIATPIGNLEDISARAARLLGEVDRVLAEDTRHTRRLLNHLGIDRPLQAMHDHNEVGQVAALTAEMQGGRRLALVSDAGTPLISDPGFPLVRACRECGIDVFAVPGPSALTAALSVAGLPIDRFRFEGFLPRRSQARRDRLAELVDEPITLVFYESSHRIAAALADCVAVFGAGRRATIARELTKRFETVRYDTLGRLRQWVEDDADQQRGELVLMVAGRTDAESGPDDRLLRLLLEEVPVRQAASIVARFTGAPKNAVYRRALALRDETRGGLPG
jgi:16S rRNA (cytidine1402-2'-O)-methyltransferase